MTQHNTKTTNNNLVNEDGGCTVDWSWLQGRKIASVRSNLTEIAITFTDGLTLRVNAQVWQGKPWLSFDPWREPRT